MLGLIPSTHSVLLGVPLPKPTWEEGGRRGIQREEIERGKWVIREKGKEGEREETKRKREREGGKKARRDKERECRIFPLEGLIVKTQGL